MFYINCKQVNSNFPNVISLATVIRYASQILFLVLWTYRPDFPKKEKKKYCIPAEILSFGPHSLSYDLLTFLVVTGCDTFRSCLRLVQNTTQQQGIHRPLAS